MLTPREIIAEAWAITVKERSLRHWGYAAAFFETMRNVELLLYQAFYLYMFRFHGEAVGWFWVEEQLFHALPMWAFVSVTGFIVLLFIVQLFLPTMATGAIIGLAAKSYKREDVKGGLVLALYNFLPILEIHGLFLLSNFAVVLTIASVAYRFFPPGTREVIIGFALFLMLISVIFRFFASFAEEGVVIRKMGVFDAIGRSFKLIISNLTHIVFLLLLLFVISLRIFINAIVILLLPGIVIGIAILLARFFSVAVSYLIAGTVGLALLLGVSYLFAYLQVFRQTVWTLTYMELNGQKDLDVIEGNG